MADYYYSEKYYDDDYEYRHVILPERVSKYLKITRLLEEREWRKLGICQSAGWEHYHIHKPEPHVLLFRRHLNKTE
ncbi:hypothetical protein GJ496_003693 [Pomphorhynchus laevis]|nr:hypothetical protein GJ496_003693 [Pomphorhynchus laevis]